MINRPNDGAVDNFKKRTKKNKKIYAYFSMI